MKELISIKIISIYLILLLSIYAIHVNYFHVDVVFYSSLLDALIACVIIIPIMTCHIFSKHFNYFERLLIFVVCLLLGYIYSISVPTVIDRSLSFYILQKIEQRGGIQLSKFENVFTQEYVKEHSLVEVRLTEQQVSGTIEISGDCVKLTERGKKLVSFSLWFRENLIAKNRLLNEEYTNKLTLPFNSEINNLNYECK
jgi:hypothetical protein